MGPLAEILAKCIRTRLTDPSTEPSGKSTEPSSLVRLAFRNARAQGTIRIDHLLRPAPINFEDRPPLGKAISILVVEDDAMIGMLLAEILKGMGHRICAVETTEVDAVTAAARHRPDLVIADSRLGQGSGISTVDKILRIVPIRYVFITGDPLSVKACKPDAVVVGKPFRTSDIISAIELALLHC